MQDNAGQTVNDTIIVTATDPNAECPDGYYNTGEECAPNPAPGQPHQCAPTHFWNGEACVLRPAPGVDPACKPGWTYSVALQRCVECTGGNGGGGGGGNPGGSELCTADAPATPAAPTVTRDGCDGLKVKSPAWPNTPTARVTKMKVRRSADNGVTWQEVPDADAGTFPITASLGEYSDIGLDNQTYIYQVQAWNGVGNSAWSPSSLPVFAGSPLTLEFIAPEEGQTLHGWEQIAIRVTGNVASENAHIFYKGNELTGVQRSKADAKVWFVDFNTDADPRQGEAEFSAYVVDANDCPSPTVTITRVLNNTSVTDLAFIEVIIEHDDPIAAVQAYAHLSAPTGLRDYYYEWAVYNPPPASSPMADNPTAEQIATYESEWPSGQKILLDSDEGLLQPEPGGTCVLRGRRTRTQRVVEYDTVAPVTKFRAGAAGEMLAFALPRIYSLTKAGGWVAKHNLSAPEFDVPGATDATIRKDKIIAASGTSFVFLDIATGETDLDFGTGHATFRPRTETKPALFAEYLPDGDVVALVFGDNSNTSLYVIRADQSKAVVSFAGQTTHVHAAGKYLALAVGSSLRLFEAGGSTAPVVLTHTAAISFVRVEDSGDIVFGDANGSTARLIEGESVPTLLDDQTFPTRAWAPYALTTAEVTDEALGALGGDSQHLYQEVIMDGIQAIYAQSRDFGAGATIIAMERYTETVSDTVFESLLVAISDAAGDYVARISRAPKPLKSYEGSDASDIAFAATVFA